MATFEANNGTELNSALASASGSTSDVITCMNGGDYSAADLTGRVYTSNHVTVIAETPLGVTLPMNLTNSEFLLVDGIWCRGIFAENTTRITVQNCESVGYTGTGPVISGGPFDGREVGEFDVCTVNSSTFWEILDNHFHDARSDLIHTSNCTDMLIKGNRLLDAWGRPPPTDDHTDGIQIGSPVSPFTPLDRYTIQDNILASVIKPTGYTVPHAGILMKAFGMSDCLIENNLIDSHSGEAISCFNQSATPSTGMIVRNNYCKVGSVLVEGAHTGFVMDDNVAFQSAPTNFTGTISDIGNYDHGGTLTGVFIDDSSENVYTWQDYIPTVGGPAEFIGAFDFINRQQAALAMLTITGVTINSASMGSVAIVGTPGQMDHDIDYTKDAGWTGLAQGTVTVSDGTNSITRPWQVLVVDEAFTIPRKITLDRVAVGAGTVSIGALTNASEP